MKASVQLLVLLVVFFALWLGLSQIDYVKAFTWPGWVVKPKRR